MKKRTSLFKLFMTFLKIGLFTFGGGYAMIPLIQRVVVEDEGWLTYKEMLDIIIVAESTPGPISLNMATFVGYQRRGVLGAVFATLGLAVPSVVIITVIALFFDEIKQNSIISGALSGIKTAIVILVTGALFKLMKLLPNDAKTFIVIGLLTALMFALDMFGIAVSGILFILGAAVLGLLWHGLRHYLQKRGRSK
jgi:chromate transporter